MTNWTIRPILPLIAAACLAVATAAEPSQARSLMASAGRAVTFADSSCFVLSYSAVYNVCSSAKSWEVPLVVDSSGNKTVTVTGYGATSDSNVCSEAVGVNKQLTAFWSSGQRCLPAFGSSQDIVLSTYVPAAGGLFVASRIESGARMTNVNW